MPFDGTTQGFKISETVNLPDLAYVLRHREFWPRDFVAWDFGRCETCAIGLSFKLWPNILHLRSHATTLEKVLEKVFGIHLEDICKIFGQPSSVHRKVSPEDVADRIDAYLTSH
jgi:hypothetical protein